MNFSGVYQREKRNPSQMYHPMHHSVANYWTEAFTKSEMKHGFNDELFLNNIHLIPDPLKKNLADTLFNNETPKKPEKTYQQDQKMTQNDQKVPSRPMRESPTRQTNSGTTFGGITSFFSGVMNVLTNVMFRSRSPVNYYDCFDVDNHQGSAESWRRAKTDGRDKNGQADDLKSDGASPNSNESCDMNIDSRATVSSCESKLNQVLHLLTPRQTSSPVWVRKRPKKVFVEPGSVEESFEDAFSPEDFVSLSNDSYIEYYSPVQYHCEDLYETASPKTMTKKAPVSENTDIVKDAANKSDLELKKDIQLVNNNMQLENSDMHLKRDQLQLEKGSMQLEKDSTQLQKSDLNLENKQQLDIATSDITNTDAENSSIKNQLVTSCEDKLTRLKALLQEKRMKCTRENKDSLESPQTLPPRSFQSEKKFADKRFKNPSRRCNKRPKSKLKCTIEDDLVFANEINLGTPPSVENSPLQHTNVTLGEYFDEVSGRFRTASIGSDDSFQIVFNDCCPMGRTRKTSDCDSEDSFIVFEDSPESCYTSNDVFGESDDSDSDAEMSDSGCGMVTCKLAHSLTRTVGNLADDSLYVESEDEVDFVKTDSVSDVPVEKKTGLLIDEKKKLIRKSQPAKQNANGLLLVDASCTRRAARRWQRVRALALRYLLLFTTVRFSTDPPKVHVLRVWAFAARQARAGHWERYAVDRERFKRRIADVDVALSWVLKPQHRSRVMFQRFMPWWNQMKRKELAEKKEREEEEKRKEAEKREQEERLQAEVGNEIGLDAEKEATKEEDTLEELRIVNKKDLNEIDKCNNDSCKINEEVRRGDKDEFENKEKDSQNESYEKNVEEGTRRDEDSEECRSGFSKNVSCQNKAGKVVSNLITQNDEIVKKVLAIDDVNTKVNCEEIYS